jgi:hypothetical protein
MSSRWTFGVEPLEQTCTLAAILRRITGMAVALEQEDAVLDRLIENLVSAEKELAARVPGDPAPRIGAGARPDRRVYIDHSRSIGAFNPCFPEYDIAVRGDRASGTVSFPLAYEGPPGVVHGGLVAVFFDCAIQHHNCDVGVAGKTTSLSVSYRRPTPVLELLDFEIERTADARRISSTAQLSFRGSVLCTASMEAVAGELSRLPAVSPRRSGP